jgi:glycosyltransferase involved in cell wall biosynthesis
MKLSVVLPVASYNVQWLAESINSTSGIADELIVVPDEGCEFNVNFYNNPLIHKEVVVKGAKGRGLAMAINAGISVASGDWISFLCSDDYYDVNAYKVKEVASTHDEYDMVGGIGHIFGDLGDHYWPTSGDIVNLETTCCITSPCLFKKSMWWKVQGYSDVRYLDWHLWKKMIKAGARYHWVNSLMYHYRAWPGTISARYAYSDKLGHEWGTGPKEYPGE